MVVKDVMTSGNSVRKIKMGQPLSDAAKSMKQYKVSALPVVDHADKVVGIVSRRDIEGKCGLECKSQGLDFEPLDAIASQIGTDRHLFGNVMLAYGSVGQTNVDEIMTKDVITAREDEELTAVIRRMAQHQINHLPVVNYRNELRGIIARADIIRAVAESASA